MSSYIRARLVTLIPTLFAIVFIVFFLMELTPGNPATIILGERATPEAVAKLTEEMGFDQPFLARYISYMINIFKGDLGNSYRTGNPVFQIIMQRLSITATLAILGMLLAIIIGLPLGILASVKQYSIFDVLGTSTSMLMASVPGFWFGLMFILLFGLVLGWLPSYGLYSWKSYILPSLVLAIPEAAIVLRMTRTSMLETIREDYIRTARAKGQKERKVIYIHALKNSLLPVITMTGLGFGYLLGGAVVVESVFSINGVGLLILDAIRMKDIPVVIGCTVVLSSLFMLIMLVIDVIYALVDPRIKMQYQKSRKRSKHETF